jgi:triacylglycerol lipase
MGQSRTTKLQDAEATNVSLWTEALFAAELLLLYAAPVYYGMGVPDGDGSGVVLIPGLLAPDFYLKPLHSWLSRIGYEPYFAGIACNAQCPNLLIEGCLNDAIERALAETGRKVHLIGHSLGGIIARSIAAQRPSDVASVITLGAPFRGNVAHRTVLRVVEMVRDRIRGEYSDHVLPDCYTARCTCDFVDSLRRPMPDSVQETAIYTEQDGIVDWRYCRTNDCENDFEVTGTHIGLVYNPSVYSIIATRLAAADLSDRSHRQ